MTSAWHFSEMEELECSANIWSTLGTVGSGQLARGRADHGAALLHELGSPRTFLLCVEAAEFEGCEMLKE